MDVLCENHNYLPCKVLYHSGCVVIIGYIHLKSFDLNLELNDVIMCDLTFSLNACRLRANEIGFLLLLCISCVRGDEVVW